MQKMILIISMLVNALLLSQAWAIEEMWADDRTAQEARDEQIYGSQLMTDQERSRYRQKMHTAPSEEERAKIRREHHDLMQERAKARGITLPEAPEHATEHDEHMHGDKKMHN